MWKVQVQRDEVTLCQATTFPPGQFPEWKQKVLWVLLLLLIILRKELQSSHGIMKRTHVVYLR